MGLSITWFVSDNDSDEENTNKVIAYIGKHDFEGESCDEDIYGEEITVSFRLLITKCCIDLERQKKIISFLHQDKEQLATIITCIKK